MNTDFKDVMSKRTDEQLIRIVTVERADYNPLAVDAAENEIKIRGIETSKIEEAKLEIPNYILQQKENERRNVHPFIRLGNYIIDSVVILIIILLLLLMAGAILKPTDESLVVIFLFVLTILSIFGYYIFMEFKFQKTIGKMITKTKVLRKDGERPELNDIVLRTICRLIPFDRISYLFRTNGFHDYLSNTILVHDNYNLDENPNH